MWDGDGRPPKAGWVSVDGAVRHGAAAVGAAVLELAGFDEGNDGVFTLRALYDFGIAVGGHSATALADPADVGGPFNPYGFALVTHHGSSWVRGSSGRLTG